MKMPTTSLNRSQYNVGSRLRFSKPVPTLLQGLTAQQPHFTITSAGYPSIPPPHYGIDPLCIAPNAPNLPPTSSVSESCKNMTSINF